MEKQLIIGLGSGRCGTTSLYRLLNSQRNSFVRHESKPMLTWKFDEAKIKKKLEKILSKDKSYVGDVASYYLPYLEHIIKKIPSTKFIILKRPQQEVIESFLRKTKKNKWKHWIKKDKNKPNKWASIFPKYNLKSKSDSLAKYWDEYYETVDKLVKKYPQSIKIVLTKNLNSKKQVKEILDFCRIDKKDQKVIPGIRFNKSGDFLFGIKYALLGADKM